MISVACGHLGTESANLLSIMHMRTADVAADIGRIESLRFNVFSLKLDMICTESCKYDGVRFALTGRILSLLDLSSYLSISLGHLFF